MELYLKAKELLKRKLVNDLFDCLDFYAFTITGIFIHDLADRTQITLILKNYKTNHLTIDIFYNGLYFPKRTNDKLSRSFSRMICRKLNFMDSERSKL